MAKQKDRFDKLPKQRGRVGAHRGAKVRGGGWLGLLGALAAIVVLTVGALWVLGRFLDLNYGIPWLDEATPTPTAVETTSLPMITDPAEIDPERGITIAVLNGTGVANLQTKVYDELDALGWPVTSKAPASTDDWLDTTIYYDVPANEEIARGLAEVLGYGEVVPWTAAYSPVASITILIGVDHPLVPTPTVAPSGSATPTP